MQRGRVVFAVGAVSVALVLGALLAITAVGNARSGAERHLQPAA
jgi:TctA family transporter